MLARLLFAIALVATASACPMCTPDGTWWDNPTTPRDDVGATGTAAEGEGTASEGEGAASGEGEGTASEGEGAAIGEGEGEGAAVGEGEGEGEGVDAGTVWLQLDYSDAATSSSPSFTFSATPGFTGSSWASDGTDYPQAWDRFNNMQVDDDPIGHSLDLSGELQLMIGLDSLTSYTGSTVHIEGRAAEVSSSVLFDVVNPLNGCGVTGIEIQNDWTVHAIDVDMGDCLLPGQGVQAIRVVPENGTIALVRMKVILTGAVY